MPIFREKNHLHRWSAFQSWINKIVEFGDKKILTRFKRKKCIQNKQLSSVDYSQAAWWKWGRECSDWTEFVTGSWLHYIQEFLRAQLDRMTWTNVVSARQNHLPHCAFNNTFTAGAISRPNHINNCLCQLANRIMRFSDVRFFWVLWNLSFMQINQKQILSSRLRFSAPSTRCSHISVEI